MKIFQPLKLRHLELKNRITFGAHTANMSEQGLPGDRHLGYYLERAIGGVAMIVVEPMPVHASAVLTRGNFLHDSDAVIAGFRRITDACKAQGAVMIQQIYHVGSHGDYDLSFHANWSPSGLPSFHDSDGSHSMNDQEINEIIQGFVNTAIRCKKCGFDGIELFAAYNSLIEQFWLPWTNRRDDKWGGGFENRMRFSTQVASQIRNAVGDDFVIGMAVSADDTVEIAMSTELLQEIAAYHDHHALVDYITCGTGSYFETTSILPTYLQADSLGAPVAEALKQVCKHTLIQAESHIRTPENASMLISSNRADLVSIVRGQIADPHWVNKTKSGREADVRGCISCNQMCWGRRSRDYWISCLVNPSAGREFEWGGDRFVKANEINNVLIVGGGPAGLEAARAAAECGHIVTLAEAAPKLGGQFRLAGLQPRRSQILELINWYERQLSTLGVNVMLNSPMTANEVIEYDVDRIILATGSQPSSTGFQRGIPANIELPGVKLSNVYSVEDVMNKQANLGSSVVLIDDTGDWKGIGTALELIERGHKVVVVTSWSVFGKFIQRTGADFLARSKVKQAGGNWLVESVVIDWSGKSATVQNLLDQSVTEISADSLVLATTNVSDTWLYHELLIEAPDLNIKIIGDMVAPRLAVSAIYEGRMAGHQIGKIPIISNGTSMSYKANVPLVAQRS